VTFWWAVIRDPAGGTAIARVLRWRPAAGRRWLGRPLAANAGLAGVLAGVLTRALLAPYWVNHHLEHHVLVFVPCWRLGDAHAALVAKGHGPRMEVATSYLDVIRQAAPVSAG
jgi:fatty acid desaturase